MREDIVSEGFCGHTLNLLPIGQDPTITRSFVMSELLTSVAVPWVSEWYLSRVGASDSAGTVPSSQHQQPPAVVHTHLT